MCLAMPAEIVEILPDSDLAIADLQGVRREINVALVLEDGLAVGDWVLIHVGFAMSKVDEEEARSSLQLMTELFGGFPEEG